MSIGPVPPALAALPAWRNSWPLLAGLAALLVPTWVRFAGGAWNSPEYEHGPLVIAMAAYMAWERRHALLDAQRPRHAWPGLLVLATGLLLFVPSVWIESGFAESFAQLVAVAGLLYYLGGFALLRTMALVLLVWLLAAPLPSNAIGQLTGALQGWVSAAAEQLLYAAGYPVARSGVVLSVGQYRLLVAEACSGMNSIISLSAVGLFYLNLIRQMPAWHQAIVAAAILPIAVAANVTRVVILVLVTYHLGDEAGQGFLHDFAGFAMFMVAVLALVGIDGAIHLVRRRVRGRGPREAARG